ncbi:MAG: hypothetical protein GXO89_02535 [Chlorobi bacterium]|nr:hypothetical protein [Chlorobiota bacterium]
MEKISGKSKAVRYLIFSIIIVVVLIPAIFYLSALSFIEGGAYLKSELLDSRRTKTEMNEIVDELDRCFQNHNTYPTDYQRFVDSKPIWDSWKRDSWGNKYKFHRLIL